MADDPRDARASRDDRTPPPSDVAGLAVATLPTTPESIPETPPVVPTTESVSVPEHATPVEQPRAAFEPMVAHSAIETPTNETPPTTHAAQKRPTYEPVSH